MVSLADDERRHHNRDNLCGNFLVPNDRDLCPYKNNNGFCDVYFTKQKPFGCTASPFTLNRHGTLIIRHRYIMMPCSGKGEPAYKTFRASLVLLFGEEATDRIIVNVESGEGDIVADMDANIYKKLLYLDGIKKGGKK
jgi:hypothetical protein